MDNSFLSQLPYNYTIHEILISENPVSISSSKHDNVSGKECIF